MRERRTEKGERKADREEEGGQRRVRERRTEKSERKADREG
jgi:hypothetical protein